MRTIKSIVCLLFAVSVVTAPLLAKSKNKHHQQCEKHDYVVVGGGTAGLTLAYLLKKAGKDVVLLEAGRNVNKDPVILNALPLSFLELEYRSE